MQKIKFGHPLLFYTFFVRALNVVSETGECILIKFGIGGLLYVWPGHAGFCVCRSKKNT